MVACVATFILTVLRYRPELPVFLKQIEAVGLSTVGGSPAVSTLYTCINGMHDLKSIAYIKIFFFKY